MKSIKITGTVEYIDLGTGFWAIITPDGEKYRPIHMPDQLKTKGRQVSCRVVPAEEDLSIFMWGTPVRITVFET